VELTVTSQTDTAGSPKWWLRRLKKELDTRSKRMAVLDKYYRGDHPLPFVTEAHNAKMRNEFKGLLEQSRSNYMELVVDAVDERLKVDGLRLSAESDGKTDGQTWKDIWQANGLDAEIPVAFLEAEVKGVSYLSVWGDGASATVAVEDATQCIVGYAPGSNFRARKAALKVWTDEWTGRERANVYMPEGIFKFERVRGEAIGVELPAGVDLADWTEVTDRFVANEHGVVAFVPLRNRPRLGREGASELESVTRIQDRINGQLFLRCLAGYFGAHRQRWAIGLRMHEDDAGNPVEPFDVAVDKLWHTEQGPSEVQFGEFQATDLAGYIKAIEQDVLHIAVTTRTPRHYLIEQGQSPSGDAIRSAESGLIKKVRRKMLTFGEGVEETLRIARLFAGQGDTPPDSQIVWADPEVRSDAERTDAVIKQYQAGLIPWETAMEKLGYDGTEIRRMDSQRQGDALLGNLNAGPEAAAKSSSPPLQGEPAVTVA
jgi:hypothetical protein